MMVSLSLLRLNLLCICVDSMCLFVTPFNICTYIYIYICVCVYTERFCLQELRKVTNSV